ncbi:unnamed protein product [Danaus chrysippus]|uniref:(African queen) hypothetical protein n=1 Tax=Danaus chrysippus TaxID=151541 RepID=A0A8J2WAD0_9NEOP|nr:unnamed protein product [Danaus chrysippus]
MSTDTPMTKTSNCSNCNESATESLHSLLEGEEARSREDRSKRKKINICCNPVSQVVWGVIFIIISISGYIFPPREVMLWEKLNMRPGFPPYDWWSDPPDQVKMRAYIFNVTNHERFLQGLDPKINVEEIGPIVYLEKLNHLDIKFNENSTMTYTAKRHLIYLPDDNHIDLNGTIIAPNLALLGIASYLHHADFFIRSGFVGLASLHSSKFFVKKTVYQYLWDFRDSILDTSQRVVPGMVPTNNMGMLSRIYDGFSDNYTVKIGPQWGHHEFFKIDRLNGAQNFREYDIHKCQDRVTGATEGVMYHHHMSKSDVLYALRKTVCKPLPLYFDKELKMDGVPVYRYNLSERAFDRQRNGSDCYATDDPLPDGVSDASKCFFDFPMVASYPHFYTGSPHKDTYVTGFKPDSEKHRSYVIVEPITGTPYDAVARLQCNLRISDLSGFYSSMYEKFSNLILPIGWIEYHQEGLPARIKHAIYFMVVILPPLSTVIFIMTFLLGSSLIIKQIITQKINKEILPSIINFKSQKDNKLTDNNIYTYEKELFLRKPQLSR